MSAYLATAQANYATPYTFTTLVAKTSPANATGLAGTSPFSHPRGVAVDAAGNVYVADTRHHTLCRLTPAGNLAILAGQSGRSGGADGTGSAARFCDPHGLAVDSTGNIYVADTGNNTIRRVTPQGVVTTLAGLAGRSGSADGTGSAAEFNYPNSVAIDGGGNVYVADQDNATIRKVTPDGVVTTLAGQAGCCGSVDGAGRAARFDFPVGIAADSAGNVYVADLFNNAIRKVTSAGMVTTLAGRLGGAAGSTDGAAVAAQFYNPCGLAVDRAGNVYVADTFNHTVREVTAAGAVLTLAGFAGQAGGGDGAGGAARFSDPFSLALDQFGNLYVTDSSRSVIRKGCPARLAPVPVSSPSAVSFTFTSR